jgi:hypothetical protein
VVLVLVEDWFQVHCGHAHAADEPALRASPAVQFPRFAPHSVGSNGANGMVAHFGSGANSKRLRHNERHDSRRGWWPPDAS